MSASAPVFIGLTSIRGRQAALKRTLDSLLAQQLPADGRPVELHLFLSREPYLLDPGFAALPGFLRRRIWRSRMGPGLGLQVHWTANWGPYRKLLPLLERLTPEQQALDPLLISADDDTLYPRDWLRRLVAAQERFGCVVAFRGRQMRLEEGSVLPYHDWWRNDERLLRPSLLTVPTGKDGIAYRLSQLDWRVRDVERALAIAGHADDLWFKTHTLLTGTPSVLLHHSMGQQFIELSSKGLSLQRGVRGQPIGQTLFLSINKRGGNDAVLADCLAYLQAQMGGELWSACGERCRTWAAAPAAEGL
ncbi:MAG: hypothetical protein EA413_00770 [Cyanobium sp. PLM2.Bin73]|nr:MAG: hypothetical protein EA413_00770 [Cyanobium sp. PLM2.Bin73]